MKIEQFLDTFNGFQGNLNKDNCEVILSMIPEHNHPYLYLLANNKEMYDFLDQKSIKRDDSLRLDKYWFKPFTLDMYQFLKEKNHPDLKKIITKLINMNGFKSKDLMDQIASDFNFDDKKLVSKNISSIKKMVFDDVKRFFNNPSFDCEKFFNLCREHSENSYELLFFKDNQYPIIFEFCGKEKVLEYIKKSILPLDSVEVGLKLDLLNKTDLNEKMDNNNSPIFLNDISAQWLLNKDKTDLFEGIDLSDNNLYEIFNRHAFKNQKVFELCIEKMENVNNDKYSTPVLITLSKCKTDLNTFVKNFTLYREKGGVVNEKNQIFVDYLPVHITFDLMTNTTYCDVNKKENEDVLKAIENFFLKDEDLEQDNALLRQMKIMFEKKMLISQFVEDNIKIKNKNRL